MFTTALKRGSYSDSLEITWTTIPPTAGSVAEDYLYACSRIIYQAVNSYRSLFSNVNHKCKSYERLYANANPMNDYMRRGKLSY